MNSLKSLLFRRPIWRVNCYFNASTKSTTDSTVSSNNPLPKSSTDDKLTSEKLLKRAKRPTRALREWNVLAYSTADSYNLRKITDFFETQPILERKTFGPSDLNDLVRLFKVKKMPLNKSSASPVEIDYANVSLKDDTSLPYFFVFDEGALVFWNCNSRFCTEVILKLSPYAYSPLDSHVIEGEIEKLNYVVDSTVAQTTFKREDLFLKNLPEDDDSLLECFAVSQAMVASVKLSVNELSLENFVETLTPTIKMMKLGTIKLEKSQVLKNSGYLFELRHNIIYSDLLDVLPDFYWDREELAQLYKQAYGLLSIGKRTHVMNEKLNYCLEFDERVSTHLMTLHSHKLEVYIIFLILIEVVLGILMVITGSGIP